MFNRNYKLQSEVQKASGSKLSTNPFIKANQMESNKNVTYALGNKAKKYKSTLNPFLDQFGNASNYKTPRTFEEISKDMETLWNENPLLTLMFTFYLRMITRITQLWDGSKTTKSQKGQGLKHEGIMRMLWIAVYQPDSFWKNIQIWVSIGSWKDIFTMLEYDLMSNGWVGKKLDWEKFYQLILVGLGEDNSSNLIKKYLPTLQSSPKSQRAIARTMIAKWIASKIGRTLKSKPARYKLYRRMKTTGTAHSWQQLISKGMMDSIEFDTIHGRALHLLSKGKFLKNQGLENKYNQWISNKPVAKYTGYVYELFKVFGNGHYPMSIKDYQEKTINAQFLQLVEKAKEKGVTKLLGVIDTSGSMTGLSPAGVSAYTVAKSMTLFLSYILDGPFQNCFFEFASQTKFHEWKGSTPVEKYRNFRSDIIGNTNFQSVADKFVELKRNGLTESEFPTGIVCFSDECFDNTSSNQTNYTVFKRKLSTVFSEEFVDNFMIILWDIPNNSYGKSQTAFEGSDTHPGLIHVSGFDPAILSLLTGETQSVPKNSKEMFEAAMDQEILNLIEI